MDYLALCKQVHNICQIDGDTIVSVDNQTGMNARVVEWVDRAYRDIQRYRTDWRFRQALANVNVVAGQWEIPDLITTMVHMDPTTATATYNGTIVERLQPIDYDLFYNRFQSQARTNGNPRYISVGHDFDIYIDPIPTVALVLKFWYTKAIESLVNNTDIPIIRDEYQDTIIWKAVLYYAQEQETNNIYQTAQINYKENLNRMELDLRPKTSIRFTPLA